MVRRINGRPTWLSMLAIVALLATAVPVAAQSTGMVKGVVTDDKGQPVDGAKVTIKMNGGTGRRFESKTNKKGEYIQIGLTGGSYKITAEKDKLGSAPVTVSVWGPMVRLPNTTVFPTLAPPVAWSRLRVLFTETAMLFP